ncbi:MAG TPA: VOC family protein [Candidatus Binatia bacterium]|nr:VOC family protein [Candidatus Binatia bacterium]
MPVSQRESYPAGVPCWVETLQSDVPAALDFYGALFDWEFDAPGAMPGRSPGQYFVARVEGRDVAGIGSLADGTGSPSAAWITHIRVASADVAAERAKAAGGTLHDGPLDALPAGRLAVLADQAGARFCVWEAHAREGAQLINEPRAWDLSSLRTTDLERSMAFYGAMFGWQPEAFGSDGRLTLWRLPGYVGGQPRQPVPRDVVAIMTPVGGPSSAGKEYAHWSVDFYCDDADATADRVARLGGRVIVPPYDTAGFRGAVIADPQGATFTVSQQTADPGSA